MPPSFSQRYGYTDVRDAVQRESMDGDLRVALWNLLDLFFWEERRGKQRRNFSTDIGPRIWAGYFKLTLDRLPALWNDVIKAIRKYFFDCEWFAAYDFVEFMASIPTRKEDREGFRTACNTVLRKEMSAYRFVDGLLVEITSEDEIAAIEKALDETKAVSSPAQVHLREALAKLASRDAPDYRNSIKESISAVESVAAAITGKPKATLSDALKVLEAQHNLHPALKAAFGKLYAYTSDAQGIRHALMSEPTLDQTDARYMLVTCSAFVSYLLAKSAI